MTFYTFKRRLFARIIFHNQLVNIFSRLVAGDVEGNFDQLFSRVKSIQKKSSNFDVRYLLSLKRFLILLSTMWRLNTRKCILVLIILQDDINWYQVWSSETVSFLIHRQTRLLLLKIEHTCTCRGHTAVFCIYLWNRKFYPYSQKVM